MIHFPSDIAVPVWRFGSDEVFTLTPVDSIPDDEAACERLVSICNEQLIYSFLFNDLLGGEPYSVDHASAWLVWARKGWREATHFAFVVVDVNTRIVAACDIKTSQSVNAEIGYWCSLDATGVMTNAVQAMLHLAGEAGFRSFQAYTRPDNVRSARLLRRLGFSQNRSDCPNGRHLYRYRLDQPAP